MAMISARPTLISIEIAGSDGQPRNVTAILQESVGRRLILSSSQDISPSTLVNVRSQDRLYLGEVLKSIPEMDAKWTIHVLTRRTFMIV